MKTIQDALEVDWLVPARRKPKPQPQDEPGKLLEQLADIQRIIRCFERRITKLEHEIILKPVLKPASGGKQR